MDEITRKGQGAAQKPGDGVPAIHMDSVRILIVDDHAVLRAGLRLLLSNINPAIEIAEASNGEEALAMLHERNWDIVILDLSLPGEKGLNILKTMKAEKSSLPVLILSMHTEDQYAIRALKAGASGYLNKKCSPEEIVEAINKITQGGKYITPSLAEKLANSLDPHAVETPHERLSNRELQIFMELAKGKSVSEIGDEFGLSVKTVSVHRANILKKMNLKHNAELMFYAVDNDLVEH